MLDREQFNEKLKQETKDIIFNQQLSKAIDAARQQKIEDAGKTYAESSSVKREDYTLSQSNLTSNRPLRFKVAGDDQFFTGKWQAMMKDCAFYYDAPSLDAENDMRRKLQRKYADDLFNDVMKPRL